jgi:hypothetical protein
MDYHDPDFLAKNRRIFDAELDAWLPPRIFDIHVHLIAPGTPPSGRFDCAGQQLSHYSGDDLTADLAQVFPGRQVDALCFGWPDPKYPTEASNRYLAGIARGSSAHGSSDGGSSAQGRRYALRLLDPREDPARVQADIESGDFLGFKPYPDYGAAAKGKPLAEVTIDDMLPAWSMQLADRHGLLIMLHIPRPGRLADAVNREQITRLCRTYPNARIILAHVGRAYWLSNALGHLEAIAGLPNLYVDTTMVTHWEVLEHAMKVLPPGRILYGSDAPLAFRPGKSVEVNHGYSYLTPDPWPLAITDTAGRLSFTSFLYEELRALIHAAQRLGWDAESVHDILYGNAAGLVGRKG